MFTTLIHVEETVNLHTCGRSIINKAFCCVIKSLKEKFISVAAELLRNSLTFFTVKRFRFVSFKLHKFVGNTKKFILS